MKLATPKQTEPGETRVALTPAIVKKLVGEGVSVLVQAGAGAGSHHSDEAYREAGAEIVVSDDPAELWGQADLVTTIAPPTSEQVGAMREGAVLIGMLGPLKRLALVQQLAERRITSFSMEFIPRISRAQAMDVLSSQASIGGYRAVMLGALACPKLFPMMMTAAGTIAPSRVFVLGAGVAGLQAIATAKRLGARVEAFDVRPAVKEQVQSLGARFIELNVGGEETAGGYAKELTPEQQQQQRDLMAKHIIASDCVITTAAVFGKAPPMLIPADVVNQMQPGAVVVDMAADPDAGRGNCELTQPGQRMTTDRGVIIEGALNLPGHLPVHASQMFAANVKAFLGEIIKDGAVLLDLEDEIQKGALITHQGAVANEMIESKLSEG